MEVFATSNGVQLVSNLAWPVAIVSIVVLLTTQRGRLLLRPLLSRLRKFNAPGGWGFELSEDAAAQTKTDVEGAVNAYAPVLDSEFERLAYAEGVFTRLQTTVRNVLDDHERNAPGFRATVHVEDALVRNALYQLVDYWPSGGGAGRRFSTRFGILGRAWRLGRSLYEPDVPVGEDALILQWGMTRAQAATAASGKHSFVAVLLQHAGEPVGVLFMDALPATAFSADVIDRLEAHEATRELGASVGRVRARVASKGPGVRLLADD
jgi:hypothetical protein